MSEINSIEPRVDGDGLPIISRRNLMAGSVKGAIGIGVFGPLLAACADDGAPEDDVQATGADGAPIDLGSIVYLAEDIPAGLDWDGPGAAIPIAQFGIEQLYGMLVNYPMEVNEDGVLVPNYDNLVGQLAESFEQDGLSWSFRLREGIMSPHGNELTADDVIWTFARAKSVSGASPVSWFLLNVSSVMTAAPLAEDATDADREIDGEIVKDGEYEFTINQFESNLLFPGVLEIFALAIADSTKAQEEATEDDPWAHEWLNSQGAAGFGPYKLKEWTKGQEMIFELNENWAATELIQPELREVTLRKVPSAATRTSSIQSGDAHIATALTSRNYQDIRDSGGEGHVESVIGNENLFVHMNFSVPPWDNIALRKAMAFAMPYEDIIETGYFGAAERWYGVVPPGYNGYREIQMYDQDLDQARAFLEEAGFPGGEGLDEFGEALDLVYVAEKQDQLQPIAVAIQSALAEIGIDIQLAPIPQTQYGDRQLVKRDLPFALNDQEKPIAPDAGYTIQLFFITSEKGGLNNMVNYSNEEVDRLWLEEAKVEGDPARRDELLGQAQELIMDDVAWLPVVLQPTQVALNNALTGFAWDPGNVLQLKYFTTAE